MIDRLNRRRLLQYTVQAGECLAVGGAIGGFLVACSNTPPLVSTHHSNAAPVDDRGLKLPGYLQWGATSSYGAPYVYQHSSSGDLIGFEVEIAAAIANLMGVAQRQVETDYDSLETSLQANDFDAILNGWNMTIDRHKLELFSQAYYCNGQQIVVRTDDIRFLQRTQDEDLSLVDLNGYTVGTGAGYRAQDLLAADPAIHLKTYSDQLPFDDLAQGRLDAVLIDFVCVPYNILGVGPGSHTNKALRLIGKPFEYSNFVLAFNRDGSNGQVLQKEVDQALSMLKANGKLRGIYQRWGLWNDAQKQIGME